MSAAILLWICETGCERQVQSDRPERGPRETVTQILEARTNSTYQRLNQLVVPDRVHEIVNTLLAVDEFLDANELLCDYVREKFALGLSQTIDQSRFGNQLDIFSRYIELVNEQIEGETAVVTFMVDGKVPLRRARLRLMEGQWRYDPGDGYRPELPAAFKRMAEGVRRVLAELKSGRLEAQAIRKRPERLIEELRVNLQPGISMLPKPPPPQP